MVIKDVLEKVSPLAMVAKEYEKKRKNKKYAGNKGQENIGGGLGTKALMEGGKVGRQVKGFGKARQVKKEVDTGPNDIVLRYKEGGSVKGKM